jgi:hypothetical protein
LGQAIEQSREKTRTLILALLGNATDLRQGRVSLFAEILTERGRDILIGSRSTGLRLFDRIAVRDDVEIRHQGVAVGNS